MRAILLAILVLGSAQNPHVLHIRSGFCALSVSKPGKKHELSLC
ncbi:L-asparaginase [Salmonella enterica subsp. enterica]|nr:L-asparaginase [Salmonella enterica subsp. enterica]